jgi:release factor glutamine methyltransferase
VSLLDADLDLLASRLRAAGCVAAEEEARELTAAASSRDQLELMVRRRTAGEPLAWVTGWATFCGVRVAVAPGVYVPRPHTELLAEAGAAILPADGVAVDLCTGTGAIAAVLAARHPGARVHATDIDPGAVACARANGVDAMLGDLDEPLPGHLAGAVDVVTACPPYVPDADLHLLARDVRAHEPLIALAGGPDGLSVVERCVAAAARLLRPGGSLLVEIGGRQAQPVYERLRRDGLDPVRTGRDEDGYERYVHAARPAGARR